MALSGDLDHASFAFKRVALVFGYHPTTPSAAARSSPAVAPRHIREIFHGQNLIEGFGIPWLKLLTLLNRLT